MKRLPLVLIVSFGMCLNTACTDPALVESDFDVALKADTDVCHLNDDGAFQLITINENAYPAHVEHGDAQPGDPVSGGFGQFGDDCSPEPRLIVDGSSFGPYNSLVLTIDFMVFEDPDGTYSGQGHYLRTDQATPANTLLECTFMVSDACIDSADRTVTVWGPTGDGQFGALSLFDMNPGDPSMKARATALGSEASVLDFAAKQCGDSPLWPATGTGYLTLM
jgi:hypothetical protein